MNPITIVIPSRNPVNLGRCVDAIWDAGETDASIVVVWDGEGPCTAGMNAPWTVPARGPIEVIPGVKPFRFSVNCNIGMRHIPGSDCVLTNDDALLQSPHGFKLLQSEQKRWPEFAIIGATTLVTGQPLQFPSQGPLVGLRLVPHIAFVAVFIPRCTIDDVRMGYLDERYVCGYEDRDYCEAVNRAHHLVGVHDGCYVDHGSLISTVRGPGGPGYDKAGAETFAAKWGGPAK